MSYKLKKINQHSMYLFTGHGEPIVVDKNKATCAHLNYSDEKKAKEIKNNELSAYSLFTVPPKIEIIFFNQLGQAHDANPCNFEHNIIKSNINEIMTTFNQIATITDGKEQMNVSNDDDNNKDQRDYVLMNMDKDNDTDLGNIMYIKYVSNMMCADLEMNMTDNVLEYCTKEGGPGQYYEKYQKVGLYKYPLQLNDFFMNDCREMCHNKKNDKLGLTAEYIYLSDMFYSHFYDKYDEAGNPIFKNEIDVKFHTAYVPNLFNINVISTFDQVIKLLILHFFNGTIDDDTLLKYQHHIHQKCEHDKYKHQSLQGAVNIANIIANINGDSKVTLSSVCNHLSNTDASEKIIILVVTCRGDADMI